MHNFPQLWHSRVMRSSNLTFRGYLADTTPVLSVGSSLFVLCWCHFEHVLTLYLTVDFPASSVVLLKMYATKPTIKPCRLGNSWPPTTTYKINYSYSLFQKRRKSWGELEFHLIERSSVSFLYTFLYSQFPLILYRYKS